MLGVYLVRAAVILIPLPSPLSWILDKATEKLLKQLTKDAEEALDNLEKLLQSLALKSQTLLCSLMFICWSVQVQPS